MSSLWTRLRSLPALLAAQPSQPQRLDVLQETDPAIPWLSPGGFLNPNLDTGTDRLGQWQELHDALRDPKAAACLDLRCQVVSSLPWTLEPGPGTPTAVTDLVREALEGLNLIEDFEELAKASYYGLVPVEVHWEVRKGHLMPQELESFDPFYLNFDVDRTPTVNGRVWEPGKLILHRHGSHFRNPWGLGRGRTVPRWTRVKVAVAYATYRDYPRYAHDRLMLTYPADSGDIEQSRYIAVANKLIDAPGLVVPEGMDAKGSLVDGMQVVGVDESTMEPSVGTVREPHMRWVNRVCVVMEDGRAPEFTDSHRVALISGGWAEVRNLKPGDLLVAQRESRVKSIIPTGKGQVISFVVDGCHTYFSDDVLSHNLKARYDEVLQPAT